MYIFLLKVSPVPIIDASYSMHSKNSNKVKIEEEEKEEEEEEEEEGSERKKGGKERSEELRT